MIARIKYTFFKIFWGDGDSYNHYNTVGETNLECLPFWGLQVMRMIFLVILIFMTGSYFYIYVRVSVVYFNFWVLIYTTMCFYFLFIGSGKQKCYQKKCDPESDSYSEIDFSDPKEKKDMWLYGVGLYSIAFPLSIVNIFISFVPFKVT